MENTQEQKTPEQWFQLLREPYRSEAIKGINKEVMNFKEYPESLLDALYFSLHWGDTCETTRNDWDVIYNSIKSGETTYLEPETLKPEQMESGKWYVVQVFYKWLVKFDRYESNMLYSIKTISLDDGADWSNKGDFISGDIKSIRHATKEEVLKYFHDEVFEPIAEYKEILSKIDLNVFNKLKPESIELRHEEPTDWEAKYNKLQEVHQDLERQYRELKDYYTNSYNELKAKYDQLEPKGEKVYFYFDYLDNLIKTTDFEFALHESSEDSPIYKGVFMGKKKSVLVNE